MEILIPSSRTFLLLLWLCNEEEPKDQRAYAAKFWIWSLQESKRWALPRAENYLALGRHKREEEEPSLQSMHISHIHRKFSKLRFLHILQAEIFKIIHQKTTWICLGMLFILILMPYLLVPTTLETKKEITHDVTAFFYKQLGGNLSVLRAFLGIILIIMTTRIIGLEYRFGTLRIMLARGIGRIQILMIKLLVIMLFALIALSCGLILNALLCCSILLQATNSLHALTSLGSTFWNNISLYILAILISMIVTILLATFLVVLTRSLAFGITAAIAWFPADNLGSSFLDFGYRLTKNEAWKNVTAYFLGPNLNVMPKEFTGNRLVSVGTSPLVEVDSHHTVMVVFVYACLFITIALILTHLREVKE